MEDFDFNFDDYFVSETAETNNTEETIEYDFEDIVEDLKEDFQTLEEEIANDAGVLAAVKEIVELEAELVEEESRQAEIQNAIKEVDKEKAELEKKLQELERKRNALRTEAWDIRTSKSTVEKKLEAARKKKSLAEIEVKARKLRAANEEKYLAIAKGKTWWEGLTVDGEELKIMKHQWEGAKFLASSRQAILGDGMGLGKTLTSIAALDLVESKRAIVITPPDVTSNFADELLMWAPHRPVVDINGLTRSERRTAISLASRLERFVIVLNYEAWRKDAELLELLIDLGADSIIMDEAHSFKTTNTETFDGINKLVNDSNICPEDGSILVKLPYMDMRECSKCGWNGKRIDKFEGMDAQTRHYATRSIKNIWPMTGTVILNQPGDLFALLHIVDRFNFEYRNQFLRDYCEQNLYTGAWKFRDGGLESLAINLKSRYLARTESDAGIELPPQKPIVHELEITEDNYPNQLNAIKEISKYSQFMLESGAAVTAFNTLSLITRKRQCNVWPGGITIKDENGDIALRVSEHIQESIKIDKAIDLIKEFVADGKRVAVFSQFSTALEELNKRLDAIEIRNVRFDGSTTKKTKDEVKRNFNRARGEEAKWDVVLANYKTGGVGLNLTNAEHMIILDEEWNPGKRDQAYRRIKRIGQTEKTFVHILRIPKTIDTWLADLIETKEDLVDGFNDQARDMNADLLSALQSGDIL